MLEMKAHPNTKAIIEAWKRLSKGDSQLVDDPMADDYPDLVGRLFILQHDSNSDFSFRVAGSALEDRGIDDVSNLQSYIPNFHVGQEQDEV